MRIFLYIVLLLSSTFVWAIGEVNYESKSCKLFNSKDGYVRCNDGKFYKLVAQNYNKFLVDKTKTRIFDDLGREGKEIIDRPYREGSSGSGGSTGRSIGR